MNIKLKFNYHASDHWPSFRVWFNNLLLADYATDSTPTNITFDVDALDPLDSNELVIEHYGKTDQDTILDSTGNILKDRAVEIKAIIINGFEQPRNTLAGKKFWPVWPAHITNMPEYVTNHLYLGFNGKYKFNFPKNISQDYYDQLWEQERELNNSLTQVDENNEEWFTAYGLKLKMNEQFDFSLTELKKIIEQHEK